MQDLQRINSLIDSARDRCEGQTDKAVADQIGVSKHVVSNWRTGHKTPSLEAQCELATLAGESAARTALQSMVEATEGLRHSRLQEALMQLAATEDAAALGITEPPLTNRKKKGVQIS